MGGQPSAQMRLLQFSELTRDPASSISIVSEKLRLVLSLKGPIQRHFLRNAATPLAALESAIIPKYKTIGRKHKSAACHHSQPHTSLAPK